MELEDFLSKLDGVKRQPSGISARCPAHADHVASLSVNAGRHGGIVVLCHAGCATEDVLAAVDLTMADLAGRPHVVAEYPYYTEDGVLLYTVERWANPKTFRCRPGLPAPAQRVLYRADALAWARDREATIYVVEGEKDANRLSDLGLVSTCNVGGAGAWLPHYGEALRGCPVVVVADADPPGYAHARAVADAVRDYALHVVTVKPRYGGDVSELLDLGWSLDALEPLPEPGELPAVLASNVLIRPVLWVWPGYIPAGKVTTIEGDPGDGKSILSVDLAARWSSGAPLPDGQRLGKPVTVLMVSAEDDPEDTIAPRLRTAGADLSKVVLITQGGDRGDGRSYPFTLSRDLDTLVRLALEYRVAAVVMDPLMALLGDDVDSHSDHSVRRALWPLHQFARDTGAAVVLVRHLNKGSGAKAVYRGGGSIGIAGAARAVYAVGRDPENPTRRILANVKMNVAKEPPSLVYTVEHATHGPFIKWHGTIEASAQEIVDGRYYNEENQEIIQFLNSVVQNGEPMKWRDIVAAGRGEGWTEKQLRSRRGRSRLIKIVGRDGVAGTRWGYLEHTLAHLPTDAPPSPHIPIFRGTHFGHEDGAAPVGGTQRHGEQRERGGTRADGEPIADDDEDARDTALAAADLTCQVCGADTAVSRFGDPWWVVRCLAHSPLVYREGS